MTGTESISKDFTAGLDASQAEAVTHPGGPLLVIAGPGSGKTRVLTHRVANIISGGVPAHKVLAVTFTNKAAAEMRERMGHLIGQEALGRLWVSTFHAACAKILRIEHEAAGLPRSFSILDMSDSERVLKNIVKGLGTVAKEDMKDYIRTARHDISWCKNRLIQMADITSISELPGITEVAFKYQEQLLKAGSVDFDDLLLRTRDLFRSGSEVAEKWASRFEHVLVDEFQDTNPTQMDLVRHLVSKSRNLTAVGDLDQSIYAFRAADPEQMAAFTDEWADAKVVALEGNYRSTPEIVAVSAALIAANPAKHRAVQEAKQAAKGAPVVLKEFLDDREEARSIANTIKSNGAPLSNFAVLVRANSQTRPVEEALMNAGLDYSLVGTVRFFDRAEVKDALAWMRAAVNPNEPVSFERAASVPKRGIGPSTIAAVQSISNSEGVNLHEAAYELSMRGGRGASSVGAFIQELRAVRSTLASQGPERGLEAILNAGVRAHWANAQDAEARLENLDELVRAASEFAAEGLDTEGREVASLPVAEQVTAFLNHISLVSGADSEEGEKVAVMTVHASKGREFDTVFVVGLEEGLFPHSRSTSVDDIREERRLLFVATSRAQKRLVLSRCHERFTYGRRVDAYPSRFLADLPDEVQIERKKVAFGGPSAPSQPGYSRGSRRGSAATSRQSVGSWESDARRKARDRRQERRAEAVNAAPRTSDGPRVDGSSVAKGDKVRHKVFGEGTVTAVNGLELKIRFASGEKMLRADLAPMEKL